MIFIIRDGVAHFTTSVQRPNNVMMSYDIESIVTSHGLVVPLTHRSLNCLDDPRKVQRRPMPAVLVTSDGKLYEHVFDAGKAELYRVPIPKRGFYVRSARGSYEAAMVMYNDLHPGADIVDVAEAAFIDYSAFPQLVWNSMPFDELVAKVKSIMVEKGYIKE